MYRSQGTSRIPSHSSPEPTCSPWPRGPKDCPWFFSKPWHAVWLSCQPIAPQDPPSPSRTGELDSWYLLEMHPHWLWRYRASSANHLFGTPWSRMDLNASVTSRRSASPKPTSLWLETALRRWQAEANSHAERGN